jgi:hypothetical protein
VVDVISQQAGAHRRGQSPAADRRGFAYLDRYRIGHLRKHTLTPRHVRGVSFCDDQRLRVVILLMRVAYDQMALAQTTP